jgi:hypothetical protein
LSKRDMQELFPGAEIIEEKFCGITKSLIAVSAAPCPNLQIVGVRAQASLDTEPSSR